MFTEYGPLLTVQDVCDLLYVGKNTVYTLINEGKLHAIRTGRIWKIPTDSLISYVRKESGIV